MFLENGLAFADRVFRRANVLAIAENQGSDGLPTRPFAHSPTAPSPRSGSGWPNPYKPPQPARSR